MDTLAGVVSHAGTRYSFFLRVPVKTHSLNFMKSLGETRVGYQLPLLNFQVSRSMSRHHMAMSKEYLNNHNI
jgi:hypothetical protein